MNLQEALAIVDRVADEAPKQRGVDAETLEALRWLWSHWRNKAFREAVEWFRDSMEAENPIGRSQNANAARNRIRWLIQQRS